MPRKRLLAPEFFTHADLFDAEASCRLPLRLAFSALWCQADRRGVFPWKPREMKLACLPYDDVDFGAVLSALEEAGFVRSYTVNGKKCGVIPSFNRWQSFHRDERPSDLPAPTAADADSAPAQGQHSANTVPAPCEHGTSTPASIAVTASIAVAASAAVAVVSADDTTHLRRLAASANKGIAEQFGEQPVPLRWDHSGTARAAAALEAASVPLDFAEQALFTISSTRTPDGGRPPRTLNYYADAVIDAWRAEDAYRDAATLPTPRQSGTGEAVVVSLADVDAMSLARQGNEEAQAYCRDRGLTWAAA